jgi:hypothetical protein
VRCAHPAGAAAHERDLAFEATPFHRSQTAHPPFALRSLGAARSPLPEYGRAWVYGLCVVSTAARVPFCSSPAGHVRPERERGMPPIHLDDEPPSIIRAWP